MIPLGPATRVYLAVGATDLRKGFNGLSEAEKWTLLLSGIDLGKTRSQAWWRKAA